MFDYKLLSALAAVVEQAGFERAAQALGLSQSAVSQRIKLLEARLGQPVLLRGTPPQPTEVGRRLLNHVQQVRLLERNLQGQVPGIDAGGLPERLRIALNADSLATWWAPAVSAFCAGHNVLLELVVEDQAVGLKRMRAGEVAACVCASEVPVAGARCQPLGAMRYLALASPLFVARHFPQGLQPERLPQVPAIVFGADDRLQHRYLAGLGLVDGFVHHLCPSSEGFVQLAVAGLGWGLVPALQVQGQLARGELVELLPGRHVDVPLYWHHWRQGGELLEHLTGHLRRVTEAGLIPAGDGAA
ncbi:MAG TPA: LysR family transcriptional regulator ArgP [Pseudomonas sp.]|nr:LysR family transcriptional regulator ArgP [Pseudomonas sp.]